LGAGFEFKRDALFANFDAVMLDFFEEHGVLIKLQDVVGCDRMARDNFLQGFPASFERQGDIERKAVVPFGRLM
jgi:hypothetical protein